MHTIRRNLGVAFALLSTLPALQYVRAAGHQFNVLDFGARGDGTTLETVAVQQAIEAAARVGGGTVVIPAGRFQTGTIHLRSHVTLELEAGARLIGTTNLTEYQTPTTPAFMPEARWGKWHRGLIVGENLEDIAITGTGTIDGNKVFDPTGEEHLRGPHTLVLVDCHGVNVRDVTIVDAANYAVYVEVSDDLTFNHVTIIGGWDGIHWRGAPERWCHNMRITDCRFFTGDDSIAGRYWDNTLISGCLINSSCNGIRLIGPATRLTIANNLFRGPGEQPHRTSRERRRTNMLSGIILQPGAWDRTKGALDDVLLANNTMQNVASPVTIWTKPGNPVGRVLVQGLNASGVYRSALSVESWSDQPIGEVVVRDATIEFVGGGTMEQGKLIVKGPGVDARPLPAWGVFARNVDQLTLEDVRLSVVKDDLRPVIVADKVKKLTLDDVRYPDFAAVTNEVVTTDVKRFVRRALQSRP